MSQWTDRIKNHGIHQLLQSTETILEQAVSAASDDPESLAACERLRAVKNVLVRTLSHADPEVVAPQVLQNIVPHLTNLNNEIQAYVSNRNVVHLNNANAHADNFLPQVGAIPIVATPEDVEGIRDSITSFRRSAGKLLGSIKKESAEVREELGQDRDKSDQNVAALQQRLAELQTQLETAQNEIQTQKGRLDAAIAEFQQQFSKQQEARQEKFAAGEEQRADDFSQNLEEQQQKLNEIANAHNERFDKVCDDAREKLTELQGNTTEEIESYIGQLEKYKDKAEKLVHAIGNTGMVGGYQSTANAERGRAKFWQAASIVFFIGLIAFAVSVFFATLQEDFSWSRLGARAFVAFAFGVAAAYAARQADRHEDAERYNRRIELELASIDPYIVGMPDPTQHSVKEELAKRLFGQKPTSKKQVDVSGTNADLLRMALENMLELIKKQ